MGMEQEQYSSGSSECSGVSEPSVFLLGAGFSACVTNGALPVMTGFLDRLDAERQRSLIDFVADVVGDPQKANVEEVIGLLDQLEDSPLSDLDGKIGKWQPQVHPLRRQLGEYCLQRLCGVGWSAEHWATCVLASADSNTTIITTNYDNLAESILSAKVGATHFGETATCHHCRMRRILLADCECIETHWASRPQWQGSVLKLHGSVAWKTCYNPKCRQFQCLVADQHCRPFDNCACSCCGQPCQPVIVLPSPRKTYSQYPHLRRMWDSAAEAMNEAKSMLVFGFSFPSSDSLVKLMVRTALSHGKLRKVSIVDLYPVSIAERFNSMIPVNMKVDVETFAVPQDGSEPEWLEREHEPNSPQTC